MALKYVTSSLTSAILELYKPREPTTTAQAAGGIAAMLMINKPGSYFVLPKLSLDVPSPWHHAAADHLAQSVIAEVSRYLGYYRTLTLGVSEHLDELCVFAAYQVNYRLYDRCAQPLGARIDVKRDGSVYVTEARAGASPIQFWPIVAPQPQPRFRWR